MFSLNQLSEAQIKLGLYKLIKIFKDSGIMVIFDEVMTGFGRTGKMFALDHITEKPDIVCLAKSLTGGYIPLAATIFNEEIHREFVTRILKRLFYMVTHLLPIQ